MLACEEQISQRSIEYTRLYHSIISLQFLLRSFASQTMPNIILIELVLHSYFITFYLLFNFCLCKANAVQGFKRPLALEIWKVSYCCL